MSFGIYVHIPYCTKKCPYCDFYSIPFNEESAEAYFDALIFAIKSYKGKNISADTLYFGGGTPNLFGSKRIAAIISAVKENFIFSDNSEITLEANPETLQKQNIKAFAEAGVNRLSLGLQSVSRSELNHLGRSHTPEQVEFCVKEAQAAGINNISLDLMIGLENQTEESIKNSIDFCNKLNVTHISAYMLKIESGTLFYKNRANLILPDDERTAELYTFTCEYLEKSGFIQYEISNFAKDENYSRHNLKYWRTENYVGLGASAHGFEDGQRYFYNRSIRDFIANPLSRNPDGAGGSAEETLMLGLRLCEGVDLDSFSKYFNLAVTPRLKQKIALFSSAGLIKNNGNTISLTKQGFLVSNAVISELIMAWGL